MSSVSRKVKIVVAGLLAIGVILSIIGMWTINQNNVVNASKELTISNIKVVGINISKTGNSALFQFNVTLNNPSNTNIELKNSIYAVSFYRMASFNASGSESVTIPAHSSKTIKVTALLNSAGNVTKKILSIMGMSGELSVGVGIAGEVPVKLFNTLPVSSTNIEIGGHTTMNLSALLYESGGEGKHLLRSSSSPFKVVEVYWTKGDLPNGPRTQEAEAGDTVYLHVIVIAKKDFSQDISICFYADRINRKDTPEGCTGGEEHFKAGHKYDINSSLLVGTDLGAGPNSVIRGYYAEIGYEYYTYTNFAGIEIPHYHFIKYYEMPNSYPPRLKMIHPKPHIEVVSAGWYVNGHEVTEVSRGTWVDAKITIKSITGHPRVVMVEFCVRRDYKHWFDKNEKCDKTMIDLDKGQTTTLTIHFQANHHTWLRGYFMKLKIYGQGTWEMSNHYPPRLKVS